MQAGSLSKASQRCVSCSKGRCTSVQITGGKAKAGLKQNEVATICEQLNRSVPLHSIPGDAANLRFRTRYRPRSDATNMTPEAQARVLSHVHCESMGRSSKEKVDAIVERANALRTACFYWPDRQTWQGLQSRCSSHKTATVLDFACRKESPFTVRSRLRGEMIGMAKRIAHQT
eukprot:3095137-Pyramimonas_sp.AAC.2